MASKYAHVLNKLERLRGEEPAYQDKVNAVKSEIVNDPDFQMHASTLAVLYAKARKGDGSNDEYTQEAKDEEAEELIRRLGKEGIEDLLYQCNLRITAIEQLMVDQFENEDVTSLKLDTGQSVGVQMEVYAQVQDREKYRQWCIEEGLENLMTVPWATTNSETKDRLLKGLPEPDGVKAFAKPKFILRKA
jgi:hypothetical protein